MANFYKNCPVREWNGFLWLSTAPLSCALNASAHLCCLICKRIDLAETQLQDVCVCDAEVWLDAFFWGTEFPLHIHLSFSSWVTSAGHQDNWDSLSKTPSSLGWEGSHHLNWESDFTDLQDNAGALSLSPTSARLTPAWFIGSDTYR